MSRLKKAAYQLALRLNPPAELAFLRRTQWLDREQIESLQRERLERLLTYTFQHVPYYNKNFEAERFSIEQFSHFPTMDKSIIRSHFQDLTSDQIHTLKAFENRTGGSTGEPLVVLQDRAGVRVTGGAVQQIFYEWHGIQPGDKEIKLWGSERDLFYRSHFSMHSIRQWLSGVLILNAFRMTPERMRDYIEIINRYRPRLVRGYASNLFELAQFAEENQLKITPPRVIISSAGTLYSVMRQKIASVFGCPVYNHYGSREMHNMAMECPRGHGLHISALTHVIEVLDENNTPCPPGVEGDLVITSLLNFAMPLIRYRIGDRGMVADGQCECGRGLPRLAAISGRRADSFRTREGRVIPGEYFIHLLGVHIREHPISKYQVIQEDYDQIRFRLILRSGLEPEIQQEIEAKTRLVMGDDCRIAFEFVDDIPPTPSGKYFYTICKTHD